MAAIKKILLATRPLVPPWDEASKNFGYFLAKNISDPAIKMHVLTTPIPLPELGAGVVRHKLYSAEKKGAKSHYPFHQKARLPLYLFFQSFRYDAVHYLFTPTRFNSFVLKYFTPGRFKTLQTVATVREDLYSKDTLRSLFFADRLVTYTDGTKKKLEALGFQNVVRVYPGIDLKRFQPQEKNEVVLRHYGFDSSHFIVIYPGEYTRLGATDMLAESMITFFQNNSESTVRFLFACRIKNTADEQKREALKEKIATLGLEEKIKFEESSANSDTPSLYSIADVVAFPVSNLKGKFDVPLVIVEAYACGKPVILSDLPQFTEFSNPDICVTIAKDSPQAFSDSVAYLKDNPAVCQALGQAARSFVEKNFDLRNTAQEYEKIYQEL